HAFFDGAHGVDGLAAAGLGDGVGAVAQDEPERVHGDVAPDLAVDHETGVGREVDDLGGAQGLGDLGGEQVGVDAQRLAFGSVADGLHDGDDVALDEVADEVLVNAIDLAGVLLIDALDDADGQGADGVGDRALEAVLGQSFEDEVGDPRGGAQGDVEGGRVVQAGAVEIGDGDVAGDREFLELPADAGNERDLDAEAREHGDMNGEGARGCVAQGG